MNAKITWGAVSLRYDIFYDGTEIDRAFFDTICKDEWENIELLRAGTAVAVKEWQVYTKDTGLYVTAEFDAFLRFIWVHNIKYLFCYNGMEFFAFLEWAIHASPHDFRRVDYNTQRGENGRYRSVKGWAFNECSGPIGQRYKLGVWSVFRHTRAEGGDRHARTRGTSFYSFRNFFEKGIKTTCDAFAVDPEGKTVAQSLYEVIERFDGFCVRELGRPFCGPKKPAAMTGGGLAKQELLKAMYGHDRLVDNVKAFRRAHPLSPAQYDFFRSRKLMRGGMVIRNPKYTGNAYAGVRKYDVASLYSKAAYDMPDLGEISVCDPSEFLSPKAGYTYIAVFDELRMRQKNGMPAVFTNPWTGKTPREHIILFELAMFREEFEALQNFYTFQDCCIKYAFRVKHGRNLGYKTYVDHFFGLKEHARRENNPGLAAFAKLLNVSAWGKLAQKKDFPQVWHEYDPNTGLIRLRKAEPDPDEQSEGGSLSIVQGAYITAMGRCIEMDYILKICGRRNACDTFIYGDTDSIITFAQAPAELVQPHVLGMLKEEAYYKEFKVLCKKCYYGIKSADPFEADFHCKGITVSALVDAIKENYGVDDLAEVPADAFAHAFEYGAQYLTPVSLLVPGGRAVFYMRKTITNTERRSKSTLTETNFAAGGGILYEF